MLRDILTHLFALPGAYIINVPVVAVVVIGALLWERWRRKE